MVYFVSIYDYQYKQTAMKSRLFYKKFKFHP